jgi:pyridoxal phosphate enzyme (YggS family)
MNILNNYHNIKNIVNSLSKNVNLIVVTKNFNMDKIYPIIKAGHINFGENKVQEATYKWVDFLKNNKDINLHLLGKLQSNKVPQAVNIFDYIHSLDSEKLANKLMQEENKQNKKLKYFIQVNISEEPQKNGIVANKVKEFIQFCVHDLKLDVRGLMCIPSAEGDPSQFFKKMAEIKKKNNLTELSMGMSNDYECAIQNGATFVRVGSKIFTES